MAETSPAAAIPRQRPRHLTVGVVSADVEVIERISDTLADAGVGSTLESRTTADLLDTAAGRKLDVVIFELARRGEDRSETLTDARSAVSGVPLVALCHGSRPGEENRLLRMGFHGIAIYDDLELMLVPMLGAISAGLVCVPRALRSELTKENLSSREKQILGMLVMGHTNAEIAARLFLAESTVKSHLSTAYDKLGVRTRKDATSLILDPDRGFDRGILMISAA